MIDQMFYIHTVAGALTLYMVLVALRWLGPYIELEFGYGRYQWVSRLTDPPIELARKIIGQTAGPFDWAPVVVMLVVWFVRVLFTGV